MRDGELYPESKVRGHKKALKTIMDMTRNEIGSEKELYRVLLVRGEKERHATAEEMRQTLLAEGFDVMDEILARRHHHRYPYRPHPYRHLLYQKI